MKKIERGCWPQVEFLILQVRTSLAFIILVSNYSYRSKGLTEHGLASLGYKDTIVFRPGYLTGTNRPEVRLVETVVRQVSFSNIATTTITYHFQLCHRIPFKIKRWCWNPGKDLHKHVIILTINQFFRSRNWPSPSGLLVSWVQQISLPVSKQLKRVPRVPHSPLSATRVLSPLLPQRRLDYLFNLFMMFDLLR